jgi:hypothetical protein
MDCFVASLLAMTIKIIMPKIFYKINYAEVFYIFAPFNTNHYKLYCLHTFYNGVFLGHYGINDEKTKTACLAYHPVFRYSY